VEHERIGDVLADVNRAGNWVRGLELLGSAGFSLERALAPFNPKPSVASVRSAQVELVVTYDGNADAGFLYLPYASPASIERELQSDPLLLKCSRSVEDESATFGLNSDRELVYVRFKVPTSERPETFLRLFGSPEIPA